MQSPKIDRLALNNEVTFIEPNALRSSELHEISFESILWQAG
jgi:hypothetical protein